MLIIALVNSWRICTVDRFELSDWACERRVVSAALSCVPAAWMSAFPAQLLAAAVDGNIRRGGVVKRRDHHGRAAVLVHDDRQIVAAKEIDAVEAGVARELVDLRQQRVELAGKGGADVGVGGLVGLADERLGRLHQLGDGGDAVIGGLNGVDAGRHGVQQAH